MASRNQPFCRHHGAPRQKARPAVLRDRWSRLSCWRELGRSLPDIPLEEIPGEINQILVSLLTGRISDRVAGRFLRILLQRSGAVPAIRGFDPELAAAAPPANTPPVAAPAAASPAPFIPAPPPLASRRPAAPAAGAQPAFTLEQTAQALDELCQLDDDTLAAFLNRVVAKTQTAPSRP
jgi:hypothetical protein